MGHPAGVSWERFFALGREWGPHLRIEMWGTRRAKQRKLARKMAEEDKIQAKPEATPETTAPKP